MEAVNRRPGPESKAKGEYRKCKSGERLSRGAILQAPAEWGKAWPEKGASDSSARQQCLRAQEILEKGFNFPESKENAVISMETSRQETVPSRKEGKVGRKHDILEGGRGGRAASGLPRNAQHRGRSQRRARRPRPHYDTPEAQRSERRFNRGKKRKKKKAV